MLKLKLSIFDIYPLASRLYASHWKKVEDFDKLEKFIKKAAEKPYDIYWFFDKPEKEFVDSTDGFLLTDNETKETIRWVCEEICGE